MKYQFNLQPWRKAERAQRKQKFITTTIGVALAALTFIGLNYFIEKNYIEEQFAVITKLKSEVSGLESAQKEVDETKGFIEEINKQINAIETLQSQRGIVLKLLEHLTDNTPSNVFLNRVSFSGSEMEIEGIAEDDRGVADFMRTLQENQLLDNARLLGIQTARSESRYEVPNETEIKSFTVHSSLISFNQGEKE